MEFYSAGVGRTGSYISLDYLLEQAAKTGVVDPLNFVKEMRSRKNGMVQTDVSKANFLI